MLTSYIGADVDSKMTDLAVERNQKIVKRFSVPTTIPALEEVLRSIPGRKELTFEEGPMAGWLYRNLHSCVDKLVVCDPRRNKLITDDGDKDDPIDAAKLACLLRGNYLRPVHHSLDGEQVVFRQWISLYHDRVRQSVREVNKLRGRCRMYGTRPPRGALRNPEVRKEWLSQLDKSPLGEQLKVLWIGFDAVAHQMGLCRKKVSDLGKDKQIIKYWKDVPGIGPIRAATMLAYLETPFRFMNNPHKLWKYCGVGIQRSGSGKDKEGKPKVGILQLAWQVNRRLKDAVMGGAISAINQKRNVFAEIYERLVRDGLTPGNARHTVARKMLTVMWGMWKTQSRFDDKLVCQENKSKGKDNGKGGCSR
jgi:transposase